MEATVLFDGYFEITLSPLKIKVLHDFTNSLYPSFPPNEDLGDNSFENYNISFIYWGNLGDSIFAFGGFVIPQK